MRTTLPLRKIAGKTIEQRLLNFVGNAPKLYKFSQPMPVSEQAQTIEQAVAGAAQKMVNSLESELGKLGNKR